MQGFLFLDMQNLSRIDFEPVRRISPGNQWNGKAHKRENANRAARLEVELSDHERLEFS